MEEYKDWIGRTQSMRDEMTERLLQEFHTALSPYIAATKSGEAPLGIHWCLAPPRATIDALGQDGALADDGFRPPLPQPMRMAAGGDLQLISAMPSSGEVVRRSTIEDISEKTGRSGPLCFVTVTDDYETSSGLALRESRTVVFREKSQPGTSDQTKPERPVEPKANDFCWKVEPSSVLLFRYSALTSNSHRIHYDVPYTRDVEGYRGLLVQGPLQATLLLNAATQVRREVPKRFAYRAQAPLIADRHFHVCLESTSCGNVRCWTADQYHKICMQATVRWD